MNRLLTILILILFSVKGYCQTKEIPFTLDDRDRLIRLEEKFDSKFGALDTKFDAIDAKFEAIDARFDAIDARFEAIDARFEAINERFDYQQQQINDLKNMFYWGFGIVIALIIFLLGYIIWDRRTALIPVREKTYDVAEKNKLLLKILKEYSQKQPELAKIMKLHGLL